MLKAIGLSLLTAGIVVMLFGAVYPLVILQVNSIPSIPADGATYTSLTQAEITINLGTMDPNANTFDMYAYRIFFFGVDKPVLTGRGVYQTVDAMILAEDTGTYKRWVKTVSVSTGQHIFSFGASRYNDAWNAETVLSGTFTVNPAPSFLTGDWYIGSTKITSPSQEVTVYTNNILFKFIKTSTVPDDSAITCTVTYSGTASGSKTLTSQGSGVWSDTITLQNGTYNVDFEATDGTTIVQMSLLMGIGQEPVDERTFLPRGATLQWPLIGGGLCLIVVGVVLAVKQKRR